MDSLHIEWYGQSAFRLDDGENRVFIDPFDSAALESNENWNYPAIDGVEADLLLITHEHRDHNAVGVIGGDPHVVRSTAGTHETPLGEVIGVASEHDDAAGTRRGANVIFVFSLAGARVAHFGDLGQGALRPEQLAAIGRIDLLFVPVGGGPTIGAAAAAQLAAQLGAKVTVPMHFRTDRIAFLEPVNEFAGRAARVQRLEVSGFALGDFFRESPVVVIPAAP